jgi:hypothetical protein
VALPIGGERRWLTLDTALSRTARVLGQDRTRPWAGPNPRPGTSRLASFKPNHIGSLAISHDGRTLAYSLGSSRSDVVLLTRETR